MPKLVKNCDKSRLSYVRKRSNKSNSRWSGEGRLRSYRYQMTGLHMRYKRLKNLILMTVEKRWRMGRDSRLNLLRDPLN